MHCNNTHYKLIYIQMFYRHVADVTVPVSGWNIANKNRLTRTQRFVISAPCELLSWFVAESKGRRPCFMNSRVVI